MSGKRTDLNHATIRDALRCAGFIVEDTHDFGHGFPDLCVNARGIIVLLEVKGEHGELNERENRFHARFCDCPVYVVRSIEEALRRVEAI